VARRGEHLIDATKLDQPPCIHHRQVVDELCHQPHIVADKDQAAIGFLLPASQCFHHLKLCHHIECTGRLVRHDQPRPQDHADGDAHALLHAAAQLVRIGARDRRFQIDARQRGIDTLAQFSAGHAGLMIDDGISELPADRLDRAKRIHCALWNVACHP
jgi:hypothetical protein